MKTTLKYFLRNKLIELGVLSVLIYAIPYLGLLFIELFPRIFWDHLNDKPVNEWLVGIMALLALFETVALFWLFITGNWGLAERQAKKYEGEKK